MAALVAAAFAAQAGPAHAQAPRQSAGMGISLPVETYSLDNGLKIILAPDRTIPVVAVNLWYDVGSRNERPGRTGFAHLFEHMMFEGSANAGKGEHNRLLQEVGATGMNASTSEDRTNYYQTVPPHHLNLALWLESDRMRSLVVNEAQLANQQEIVKEERRMRVDNEPYVTGLLRAYYDASYNADTCYPYAHDVIGSMADLNAAEMSDVQDFFRTYYAPNNATLTLVGDFEVAHARAMIQEYFSSIPSGDPPPPVLCETPFAHLPVRDTVRDANATLPAYVATFGLVASDHPDAYPLQLLATILGTGQSSRLHQRLVSQERASMMVTTQLDLRRGPGVLLLYSILNQGATLDRVEELVDEELQRVREQGVTAAELDRARNQRRASFLRGLQTAAGRAESLQYHNLFLGDPKAIERQMDALAAVTLEDVHRVARQYLQPDNRAVVMTLPGRAP